MIGVGVAALLRAPLGTAYLAGLAVVGIVSAHLALVHVSFGWLGLALLAAAAVVVTWRTLPRRWVRPRVSRLEHRRRRGCSLVFLVHAWPTFASKPLDDYDGWAIWGMKGKALYLLGWADPALFAAAAAEPAHRDYPLLVPSLEAVASRAMGAFDPQLVHLQFLLFAVAGIAALHGLLRDRVQPWLLWPFLVALVAAPAVSGQLLTAYADIPLALFVAAGVVAAARWVDDADARMLALATLFFAAACLTKNEAIVFVVSALPRPAARHAPLEADPALGARGRGRAAAVADLARRPPHPLGHGDQPRLARPRPSRHRPDRRCGMLLERAFSIHEWPLLLPLFLVAARAGAAARGSRSSPGRGRLVSMIGLAGIYVVSKLEWSNYLAYSGDRVIDSVLVGAVALTPLLLDEGPQ